MSADISGHEDSLGKFANEVFHIKDSLGKFLKAYQSFPHI